MNNLTSRVIKLNILNDLALLTIITYDLCKDLKYELEIKNYLENGNNSYLDLYIKLKSIDNRTNLKDLNEYIESFAEGSYRNWDEYYREYSNLIKGLYKLAEGRIYEYNNMVSDCDKIEKYTNGVSDNKKDYLATLESLNLDNEALKIYVKIKKSNKHNKKTNRLIENFHKKYIYYTKDSAETVVKDFSHELNFSKSIEKYGEFYKDISRLDILELGKTVEDISRLDILDLGKTVEDL